MLRITLLALLVLSVVGTAAIAREYSRREIRSMPIMERPSRPGHFYGNAVRRRNSRETERATINPNAGMNWQGSTPRMTPDSYGYPSSGYVVSE